MDILVNAAGVSHTSLLPLTSDSTITNNLTTNLQGTILACRALTRRIIRRRDSGGDATKCIINISSLLGSKGGVGATTYAATKAGITALTRAIAAEGVSFTRTGKGAKLRANVIVPGYIHTKMLDGKFDFFPSHIINANVHHKLVVKTNDNCDCKSCIYTNKKKQKYWYNKSDS